MQTVRWRVFADAAAVRDAAVIMIEQTAAAAIAARASFHIVLAGGTTPRAVYEQLRHLSTDWSKWHVYYGDERCLPVHDVERNSRMAQDAWLSHIAIPAAQQHVIPAEMGPVIGAGRYAPVVSGVMFDLVLLGLGEDGHTASLFPGHVLGDMPGAPDVLAVTDAPKAPAERVSLSAACLSRGRQVLFLVTGAGKRQAVSVWQTGGDIPACHIQCPAGVDVLAEQVSLQLESD